MSQFQTAKCQVHTLDALSIESVDIQEVVRFAEYMNTPKTYSPMHVVIAVKLPCYRRTSLEVRKKLEHWRVFQLNPTCSH